jgi:hypothetical protein
MNAIAMLSALIGAAVFLMLATCTSMPVSTTHAIVGGVVGATLVATPSSCLNWGVDGRCRPSLRYLRSPQPTLSRRWTWRDRPQLDNFSSSSGGAVCLDGLLLQPTHHSVIRPQEAGARCITWLALLLSHSFAPALRPSNMYRRCTAHQLLWWCCW